MSTVANLSANVTVREYDSAEAAQNAASQEASSTGGTALPAIMFKQGARWMLTTAMLMPLIRNRLQTNHAARKGTVDDVRAATNRPVMPEHVESVRSYLQANIGQKYILPPLTLNARQPISVYAANYNSTVKSVTIVIPPSIRLEITDGGHRKQALDSIDEHLTDEQREMFYADALAVMITCESELDQIHQDFADASKTKPLPKSQLAAYDRRNPANGIVLDLIQRCAVFKGRIDSTSQTLSKNSNKLFLTNQVRQMVKELLVGAYAMADEQFEDRAVQLLDQTNSPQYAAELERFVAFIDRVTAAVPILKEIASVPAGGVASQRIPDLRAEGWVCLQATGLVVIGRIGYELLKTQASDWEARVDRLGTIDWRKTGPIWQGNIIQGGKIMTQQGPVKGAVAEVRKAIGLAQPTEVREPTAA